MQQKERPNQTTRVAPSCPRRSFQRPARQIILSLALLIFVTVGARVGAPSSVEPSTSLSLQGERQQVAGGPNSHLADTIVTWLAGFPLPENYQHPRIEIVSPMHMAAVRYRGLGASLQARVVSDEQWLEKMRDIVALYEDDSRTIYLREGWTGATPTDTSVLVHEMVHHLQNLAGEKFECAQAREKAAYAAQKKWLEMAGLDFFEEFQIDPMTLMLRTVCF